ncbi:MAG TPA: PadR family transcriptional regulator [Gemmatimonadales bacterium]|jgi:transcriptional regulator
MGTHHSELLRDTLDLLILKLLAQRPLHGWAVQSQLRLVSQSALQVGPGSLYPALHRLEHRGWISAEWQLTERKRRAKVYRLTPAGRRQLERETKGWRRLVHAVDLILERS